MATVDSADWAEADASSALEFPGCYLTTGFFADFFGRLAGSPLAVMEVECRSMGGERCRFLLASGEVMQHVYDAMGNGMAYDAALSCTKSFKRLSPPGLDGPYPVSSWGVRAMAGHSALGAD